MSLYALWTVAAAMVLVWLLGVCGAFSVGAWIHVLLVAAMLAMASSIFSRPRVV